MVVDISTAAGAMNGERYIASLKDGREVWLDGERVADVTTHPALVGMVQELAGFMTFSTLPSTRT